MDDSPSEELCLDGVQIPIPDQPLDKSPSFLGEVKEAVSKVKVGNTASVCIISAELLKTEDWKKGQVVSIWKGKGNRQSCNKYRGNTFFSVPCKGFASLLLTRVCSYLLKFQRSEESGFMTSKSTTYRILAHRILVERRRVRQGCVLTRTLFNTCMDKLLEISVDQFRCGTSIGNTKVTDFVFAYGTVLLANSLEVLVAALESLHWLSEPHGFEVSWTKTKVQQFRGLLDDTV
ncbi:uncharacterized protein LOC143021167 [Oratosquilla oratoria]|uniref:uncharacterized protein LOC143021167 n=1 Tax=Oratosquilla oratoria TaxID=337810 RepID=UPI003F76914B